MIIEEIKLYEGVSDASLTAYLQNPLYDNGKPSSRPAIILCPGGAYLGYTEKEAEPMALRFLSEGYQTFILKYSIGDAARYPAPFLDAAKAVMLVREQAMHWGIHPDHISLCGFSTGAQVAAVLGAMWHESYMAKALNSESNRFKPNALILGYPILDLFRFHEQNLDKSQDMNILIDMMFCYIYGTATPTKTEMMKWDISSRITSTYPPTFLWTTMEDSFVDVEQCLDFIRDLASNKIRYEFHVFEKGSHGSAAGNRTVGFSEDDINKLGNSPRWVELALHWLKGSMDPTRTEV